jgi:hypothetical protein
MRAAKALTRLVAHAPTTATLTNENAIIPFQLNLDLVPREMLSSRKHRKNCLTFQWPNSPFKQQILSLYSMHSQKLYKLKSQRQLPQHCLLVS